MPLYGFQERFAPLVESGKKQQTIRKTPKHHPRVGQTAYLYQGLRTKQCRKLGEGVITKVWNIEIEDAKSYRITNGEDFILINMDSFAQDDGFANWQELVGWFEQFHGLPFTGVLVQWEVKS